MGWIKRIVKKTVINIIFYSACFALDIINVIILIISVIWIIIKGFGRMVLMIFKKEEDEDE